MLTQIKTMLDVYLALPEGRPVQLINNEIVLSPASNYPHYKILDTINKDLNKLNIGEVVYGVDVLLSNENIVKPDIFIADNIELMQVNGYHGVPPFIVEVLSTKPKLDLKVKRDLYERFGVKEYFAIDPKDKDVYSHYLNEGAYELIKVSGKLQSRQFQSEIIL
jgi:Uma2 family endonuclease